MYGAAEDARIKDSGAKSGKDTPALLSSATAASIDDAIPACAVVAVRRTTAAIAMDLVIQPEREISFQVVFSLAENHRKVIYTMKAVVPMTLSGSTIEASLPTLRIACEVFSWSCVCDKCVVHSLLQVDLHTARHPEPEV